MRVMTTFATDDDNGDVGQMSIKPPGTYAHDLSLFLWLCPDKGGPMRGGVMWVTTMVMVMLI